jgi:hypothetical protein
MRALATLGDIRRHSLVAVTRFWLGPAGLMLWEEDLVIWSLDLWSKDAWVGRVQGCFGVGGDCLPC